MKQFWILFIFVSSLIVPQTTIASAPLQASKKAYSEKRFQDAITILEKETKVQPRNATVFFNLGLASKAAKQYPKAIWALEKALKLQPNDQECIQIIEACYLEMDNGLQWKDETGTFQRSLFSLGSNFWAWSALILSLLCALSIILMGRSKSISAKKMRLGFSIGFGLLLAVTCYISYSAYTFEHESNYAIVLQKDILVFSSKAASDTEPSNLSIKPGSKVKVINWSRDTRAEIETENGQRVFVAGGIARI